MKKKLVLIMLSVFVLLGLTACSTNKDGNKADGGEDITIYFLTKTIGNQYWAVVEEGAKAAEKELGIKVVVQGLNNEAEVEKQVQQLQDAVSANASAIILGPVDSDALASHVSDTFKSGIPVLMVDTMINTDDYTAAFLTDNVEAGRMAAKEMIRQFEEQGVSKTEEAVVAIQIGAAGSQTIIDRVAGFNEYWDANAPASWKVLNDEIKVNDGDITKATTIAQDFFTAHPTTLKGVFGANNGSTVGFVLAIKEAQRKDIAMVGFDYSDEIAELINDGSYQVSSVVQRQYLMGYESVKLAYDLIKGGSVKEKDVDTGVIIVNKDNIEDQDVQDILNP